MTRMQRRKSFSARRFFEDMLRGILSTDNRKTRPIRFEPLEARELMAGDFYEATSAASGTPNPSNNLPAVFSSDGLVGEGEDAPNLVEFAKALSQAGVRFFGADWCPFCTEQKALFQDGASYLPFVEMTNPDRTRNTVAINENVTTYPTWEFANGQRVTGVQSLQQLSQLSGVAIPTGSSPTIKEIANVTVLNGSPLHVPVDAYDPNGGPLTITVTSSNPSVIAAEMVANNKSWRVTVNGYGEMVFRLFADEAARPVNRIESLTNSGFYNQTANNQILFHRVIDTFMIQSGDPTGTGSGGSTLGNFDDQFDVDLQHNRTGVLSYAKSSLDDSNDSQFFVTEGPQRHLDFNHSVFGQLIEGDAVREGISRTQVNSTTNKPTNDIIIKTAEIFNDTENGLIRLKALANSGSSTITVQVEDQNGNRFSRTFTATAGIDTENSYPFLNDITVPPIAPGQTVNIQLGSQDVEGQAVFYEGVRRGSVDYQFTVNSTTGAVTVTAPTGYTGDFELGVRVRDASVNPSTATRDPWDTQVLKFTVAATSTTPTGVDLVAASDTGVSDSDNITNATTMQFVVSGTTAGATVNLRIGDQIVGTATATGSTTTISTTLVSQLGAGTRSIVATQTQNGQTSAASPALSVTFDSTAPAAIAASQLPTNANVGSALSVDLAHPEEGQGLRYSLENAPAGMTINATTGVLTWTPTSAQSGPQTANLRLTDTAGNSQTQALAINVNPDAPKVSVTLQWYDSSNTNPVTSVTVGQELSLRIIVNDLRTGGNPDGDGVFSAYMDLVYDSNLLELVGSSPVTYNSLFGNGRSVPVTTTPGLVDELGAFSSFNVGPGRDPQILAVVKMKVKASGQAFVSTNPAENASRGFTIFKEDTQVPSGLVVFGSANLNVGQNFTPVTDTIAVNEDSSNTTIRVLDNDTIVSGSGAVLTIQSVSAGSRGGTITIASDNKSVIYTPAANVNGLETFTYTVRDQNGATAVGTVSVTINAVNDNPVANNDTLTTVRNTDVDVFIPVLSNDTMGPDTGETLTVTQVGATSNGGTVRIGTGGNGVIYTPKAGYVGTDTFSYTISDGNGGTATATVTVTVSAAVPPPTVVNETFNITEDAAAAEFNVLSNDTPTNTGDTLTIIDVKAPTGTATVTSNGSRITYTPKANFAGTELVVYTVRSTNGGTATGTATFVVAGVNDPPVAVDDVLTTISQPNQSLDVLKNDTTVDTGENLVVTAVTQPEAGKGTVSIGPNGKSIIYSAPNTDFAGTVTFSYTLGDGSSLTDTATVTLTVQNYKPRDIGIVLPSAYQSLPITVEVIPPTGSPTTAPIVKTANGVKVVNVGPGEYRFKVPDLPFMTGSAQTIVINSGTNDTSSLDTVVNLGVREARFVDIRDFMGQSLRRGLTAAVTPTTTTMWSEGQGDWRSYSNVQVSLNTAGTTLTVRATNPSNQTVQATLPVNDPKVVLRGTDGAASLYRIQANPSELSFSPVSSATGEGEGEGLSAQSVDQAMQQIRDVSGAAQAAMAALDDAEALAKRTAANSNSVSNGYRRGFGTR